MQWLQNGWTRFEMVFYDGKVVMFKALPNLGWENIKYFDEQYNEISYKELKRKYGYCEFLSSFDERDRHIFVSGSASKWLEYIKNLKQ